jgi:hypothetical protein
MPEKMPEKTAKFIEAECLKAARREQGCSELQSVRIGPLKPRVNTFDILSRKGLLIEQSITEEAAFCA